MTKINLTCDSCGKVHEVDRSNEIPNWVISLGCNWCPLCEDQAEGYWEEYYKPDKEGDEPPPEPIPDDPNQLVMPFIFDELEIKKIDENNHVLH